MSDLVINGNDALATYGVRMGVGFIKALRRWPDYKENISNESRLENGTRYIVESTLYKHREVTLPFVLIASTSEIAKAKESEFRVAMTGEVRISVPADGNEVYRLIPTGVSSYAINTSRNVIKISIKFIEQNPAIRNAD